MSSSAVVLHPLSGAAGTGMARALDEPSHLYTGRAASIAAFPRFIASVSGPAQLLREAGAGLPDGPARAEAAAVRLRRSGAELHWGEPVVVRGTRELHGRCRQLGASSVEMFRADPSLLTELRAGSWFDGRLSARIARRAALCAPAIGRSAPALHRVLARACADAAFWSGVREAATGREWRRLSASSYVVLLYHRTAGDGAAGQERLDVAPARLRAQLRVLALAGFRALDATELLAFHADPEAVLDGRRFVVTVDDGFLDNLDAVQAIAEHRPQLFISTSEVGGCAHWMAREPLLDWPDLRRLSASGIAIGSHARSHRPLAGARAAVLDEQVEGSLQDLRVRLGEPLAVLSYPYGSHDDDVCRAAQRAGFRAAYTTAKGVNGAGTHPYCLKRVSVHARDGLLAVLWKAVSGEPTPRLRA